MSPGHIVLADGGRSVSIRLRLSWTPERRWPRRRRPLVGERVEERAVADAPSPAGTTPQAFADSIASESAVRHATSCRFPPDRGRADDQVRRGNRVAHDAVGGHPAGDADEALGGLVDDPLDLRRHGDRQIHCVTSAGSAPRSPDRRRARSRRAAASRPAVRTRAQPPVRGRRPRGPYRATGRLRRWPPPLAPRGPTT